MGKRDFQALSTEQWGSGRLLCVGLDSDHKTVADIVADEASRRRVGVQAYFNMAIVDATLDIAGAYKPNSAFYEARGADGIADLRATIAYIHKVAPDLPVILDAKRGDIGSTNAPYCEYAFRYLEADALTVHPYLGVEALGPFLDYADKGVFVLCRTSNQGAGELQDQLVGTSDKSLRLFEFLAESVAHKWNRNGNCGLVVGATYPDELRRVRDLAGDLPLLIPGVGAQGGDLYASVRNGLDSNGGGVFLNASRSVIFSSDGEDFAAGARAAALALDLDIRSAMGSK